MKPRWFKPRFALAAWWLIGALVLAVFALALWRSVRFYTPVPSRLKGIPAVSSAWRLARGSALAMAGVSVNDLNLPCSGDMIKRDPKPHPTARLYYSNIEPSGMLAAGETLHATAMLDCPSGQGLPVLLYQTGMMAEERLPLYDDGTHGDRAPDDGLWEVDLVWDAKWFDKGWGWAGVYLGLTDDYDCIPGVSVKFAEKPPWLKHAQQASRPPGVH